MYLTMKFCVYDNPMTMTRQCWQDGELISTCSSEAITHAGNPTLGLPRWMLNAMREWSPGRMLGDVDAMKKIDK